MRSLQIEHIISGTAHVPMSPPEIRSGFRAQGFLLLPSLFERSLMDDLRMEMDLAREAEEKRYGHPALEQIGQDGYISDILAIGPAFEAVLDSDVLHDILSTLLHEARLCIGQGIILDPGKGRGIWPRCWHADMYEASSAIHDSTFCFGVNCLVLVDDIDLVNGPTGVLLGSQRLHSLRVEQEQDLEQIEFKGVAPSGSLLLIEGGTWHSAGFNRSSKPRRVFKLLFTQEWIRPQIDYSAAVSPKVAERLSRRVKRLLRFSDAAGETQSL